MAKTTESASLAAWRESVEASLKGASFEKRLVTHTVDGLRIEPLYSDQLENQAAIPARAESRWQRHEVIDLDDCSDLEGAVDSALERGLDGFRVRGSDASALQHLGELVADKPLGLHPTDGTLLIGGYHQVSTLSFARSGAGLPHQIGFALAMGADWLRSQQLAESSEPGLLTELEFEIGLDGDLFQSIAGLRALRWAWARLVAAAGGSAEEQVVRIHATNSERHWTTKDPWVNILRATTGTFAAAIGGADSIVTLPFDEALGQAEEDALRLASNTQALLDEESMLTAVQDPAAGSGYLEELTRQIAEQGWAIYQQFAAHEAEQPFSGIRWHVLEMMSRSELEAKAVASRKQPIVGVSEFPNLSEETLRRKPKSAPPVTFRTSAPFEELRHRAEALSTPPLAFLANLGSPAEFRPRASFASNFLAAGGIRAVENEGFEDVESAVQAFRESGLSIAVICSSDESYRQCASEAAEALQQAGARILLAGRPGDQLGKWRRSGVDEFIHLGCDALATLDSLISWMEASA